MQTGVLVEPFRRKRAKKNGPFGAVLKSAYASVWVGSISVGLGMGCSL